ncbi:hypothetical protein GCM10009069_29660 [Algimonas arctica]|uniref:Transposase n=1 Tax=Algimonas arctica TaxID=1479486 RepID=A0A8J3G3M5_9PROT|nr:hypothetical protein [Algimonas arctica]GHB05264.1 hypothetical protein GCM10009069_29660 [Algimonas arctica]
MAQNPFRHFKTPREIIQPAMMMHGCLSLSLRNVEGPLHERGIDICYKNVRLWVDRFGPAFTDQVQSLRSAYLCQQSHWQWHLG